MPEFIAEKRIDGPGVVDGHIRHVREGERRIDLHLDVRMVEHPVEDRVVAVGWNSLQIVLEVVDVVVVAHRHALDDRRVYLLRRLAPLLRGVAAEERVEDRRRVAFVLHEARDLPRLQLHAEELVDEREAEGKVVYLALIVRKHLVLVAVELGEAADEVPHRHVVRVEDVAAVEMHLDARRGVGLAADVAANCAARFEDEDLPPRLRETARDRAAPETGACDNRVRSHDSAHLIACAPLPSIAPKSLSASSSG